MLFLLLPSISVAWAQDSEISVPAMVPPEVAALQSLQAQVAALQGENGELDALLVAAGAVVSPSAPVEVRVSAVVALSRLGDVRALPFLEHAARQEPVIREAVLAHAATFGAEPRMHALVRALAVPTQPESVQVAAVVALDAAQVPDAEDVLWHIATSAETAPTVRSVARGQLNTLHAAAVAARGGLPAVVERVSPGTVVGMALPSAVVGSTLLASVGKLGQTDAGPGVGGVGGAVIGGGVGALAARARNVSPEDSLQYTSGTAWGLAAGAMLSLGADVESENALYFVTLGTAAGAGGALLAFENEPSIEDTLELNGAILLGQQMGAGVVRWAQDDTNDFRAPLGGLIGGSLGGVTGAALRRTVSWDDGDASLLVVGGGAGLWFSQLLPPALGIAVDEGAVQVAIPLGVVVGTVAGQALPLPARQTGIATYGFASGNLIGLSVPLLVIPPDALTDAPLARWTLLGGAVGAAGGAVLAPRMTFDRGDATLIPVGTFLTLAEVSALSRILVERTDFAQPAGLILLGVGAGSAGFGGLSQIVDAEPGAALLVASAAGWGVFYGGLTPIALGLEGESVDLLISMTATGTGLMAGAVVAQLPAVGLEPQTTLLPQLGGVGGAVVGSVGTALFTEDGQTVSAGALGGSLLGFGAGILLERTVGERWVPRWTPARFPLPQLPGRWHLTATPTRLEDETTGLYLGIQATGL